MKTIYERYKKLKAEFPCASERQLNEAAEQSMRNSLSKGTLGQLIEEIAEVFE
jgi:hypothetical protein